MPADLCNPSHLRDAMDHGAEVWMGDKLLRAAPLALGFRWGWCFAGGVWGNGAV